MIKIFSYPTPFHHYHVAALVLMAVGLSIIHPLSLAFVPHLIGLLGLFSIWRQDKKISAPPRNLSIIIGSMILLAFLSSFWSVTPDASMERSLKIGAAILLSLPFFIMIGSLTEKNLHLVKSYLPIPIIIGAIYLLIELMFNFPFAHLVQGQDTLINAWQFNKHTTVMMLIAPFGIYFALQNKQKMIAGIITFLCLMIVLITDSQATQLAAIAMILVATLHRFAPKFMLPLCFGGVFVLFILMPWISQFAYNTFADNAANSVLSAASPGPRLEIWDFVSTKILESPWVGFGIDTTRAIEFHGRMVYFQNTSVLHPHNIALQIWIEFGALGIALASILLLYLYCKLRQMPVHQQLIPLVIFTGCMSVMLVSWSIWAGWFVGLVLFLIGLCRLPDTKNAA